jgi:hypothetical protein
VKHGGVKVIPIPVSFGKPVNDAAKQYPMLHPGESCLEFGEPDDIQDLSERQTFKRADHGEWNFKLLSSGGGQAGTVDD